MKKNKLHLAAINIITLLMLYCTSAGAVHASLMDELQPIPVNSNWNAIFGIYWQMHSTPDGDFLSYVEYKGELIAFDSEASFGERPYTYRHVVFDRRSGQFAFGPEISIISPLNFLSALTLLSPVVSGGDLYFSVPEGASIEAGVYFLDFELGSYRKVLNEYTSIFSISGNKKFALVSKSDVQNVWSDGVYIYDLITETEYPVMFEQSLRLDMSSSLRISDAGSVILKGNELYLVNPVANFYQSVSFLLDEQGWLGNGAMISPDDQYLVARKKIENTTYLVVRNVVTGQILDYPMSMLGFSESSGGYPIDLSNMGVGLSIIASVGADGELYHQYSIERDDGSVDFHYAAFGMQQGNAVYSDIISVFQGDRAYIPMTAHSQKMPVFYLGILTDQSGGMSDARLYFRAESQRSLKINAPLLSVDTYYTPQFAVNVNSHGEHYAIDVGCSVTGPASLVSASYGDWGSDNRLQLPLQLQSDTVHGALSQRAPDVAVTGEQSLLETVILAEMVTGSMSVTCAGEMSDSHGNLLSVTPATVTVILDNGIHGGDTLISGQILFPEGVLPADVQVSATINGRTISVNPDADGNFSFAGLRAGDFIVSFHSEGYVQACISALSDGLGNIALNQVELLAGDINRDGVIDIADFTFLAGRYGTRVGDDEYSPLADLNSDGAINIQDLAILASHFGSQQCQ